MFFLCFNSVLHDFHLTIYVNVCVELLYCRAKKRLYSLENMLNGKSRFSKYLGNPFIFVLFVNCDLCSLKKKKIGPRCFGC